MALLERVSTLLRANFNDLIDKAEDPEKLSKQILLDMESQLLQVKTQVAVAIADQHRLSKSQKEHQDSQALWRQKAELAVEKGQDDLARAALERSISHEGLAEGFGIQHADQTFEAETLRIAYGKLETKLAETKAKIELLLAQHRRNRSLAKTVPTQPANTAARLSRLSSSITAGEMAAQTTRTMRAVLNSDTVEDRFLSLEHNEKIEALLLDLKQGRARLNS